MIEPFTLDGKGERETTIRRISGLAGKKSSSAARKGLIQIKAKIWMRLSEYFAVLNIFSEDKRLSNAAGAIFGFALDYVYLRFAEFREF